MRYLRPIFSIGVGWLLLFLPREATGEHNSVLPMIT